MGGVLIQSCTNSWDFNEAATPQLALRVASVPIDETLGTRMIPCNFGDEITVEKLERVKAFDPLLWRFERSAKERASASSAATPLKIPWPQGYRCSVARRYWKATCSGATGKIPLQQQTLLLAAAASPQERTAENVELDIEDCKDAALYAHRFNMHISTTGGESHVSESYVAEEGVPGVKICVPIGCQILASAVPQLIAAGDIITLIPYPCTEVRKFVFDGSEDFLEIPQAFFHHVAFTSGGREMVVDLQGSEDEDSGDVLLVDPCVLRSGAPSAGNVLSTLTPSLTKKVPGAGPSPERFDLLHPKCSHMCKVFDPNRKGGAPRNHCGLGVACGL